MYASILTADINKTMRHGTLTQGYDRGRVQMGKVLLLVIFKHSSAADYSTRGVIAHVHTFQLLTVLIIAQLFLIAASLWINCTELPKSS